MFCIVNFTAILLLSAICICEKESVCVYFVADVRVIGISEKSIYDQQTCPIPQQESISSTPESLTPAALSFKNEMQISALWEFRSQERQRTEKDAQQTNRFLCWEQRALSEVPHNGTFHWHITASRVLQGSLVLFWLEMLSIYVMGQCSWFLCLSELCQVSLFSQI